MVSACYEQKTVSPALLNRGIRIHRVHAVAITSSDSLETKASVFEQYGREGEPLIEVHTTEGVQFSEDISHGARIQGVMGAAFDAIRDGATFEPTVADAVRILEIQDAVYAHARQDVITHGPHPMG